MQKQMKELESKHRSEIDSLKSSLFNQLEMKSKEREKKEEDNLRRIGD